MEEDKKRLCGDHCHFYNTRFEADNLIWLFLFIGYLAVIDCIVNFFYNLVVIKEFTQILGESGIPSNEEMELDEKKPKESSNSSLVSQNERNEPLGSNEAAPEDQGTNYEMGAVNAEIQEILADIKEKKAARKGGAAKKQ